MAGLLVDYSQKGMSNSTEYHTFLDLQSKKLILKKNKKFKDNDKQNITIQLEKVYKVDPE